MHITGTFAITSWEEDAYAEIGEHGKMTRAAVVQDFSGDFDGDGQVEYLMAYSTDETARFVGQQWLNGEIGDRSGSFVLQISGTFDGETAQATWTVVEGTGTGDFGEVTGQGGFSAPLGEDASYALDLSLDAS
jgi:hypothetical protein